MPVQFTCLTCGRTDTRKPSLIKARNFCGWDCYHADQRGRPRSPIEDRFWSKVDKNGPTLRLDLGACWLWLAARNHAGYGLFGLNRKSRLAHVVSYILTTGHEPPAETPCILHHCDGGDMGCVRPSHLYAGTRRDNSRDAVERGRVATGDRSSARLHPEMLPRGEQSYSAKLTAEKVREIRRLWAEGNHTQVALGAMFGVAGQSINQIVLGKAWRHVL